MPYNRRTTLSLGAVVLALLVSRPAQPQGVSISDTSITVEGEEVLTAADALPLYARGTGLNNNANRLVRLGDIELLNDCNRGLTLTILDAATHSEVLSNNYDTWGSAVNSDALAQELDRLDNGQIGVLTSCDAFERSLSSSLRASAARLGLLRLAATPSSPDPPEDERRRPYAAIFYGSARTYISRFDAPNSPQAVEIMQTPSSVAPYAILATWLIGDGFVGQAFSPQGSSCLGRRWLDQGDGTVLDCNTRLIWLKDAGCGQTGRTWQNALDWVGVLNITPFSIGCTDYVPLTYTDWRMPTVEEWCSEGGVDGPCPWRAYATSMVDGRFDGAWHVSNNAGENCYPCTFTDLHLGNYWSTTEAECNIAPTGSCVWAADLFFGLIVKSPIESESNRWIWPVRGGPDP